MELTNCNGNTRGRKLKRKEIIIENFSKLMTAIKPQIQETQKTSSIINTKILYLGISYSNCKKSKTKRKPLRRTVPQGKSLQRTEPSIIFTVFERALKRIIKYQTYKIFDLRSVKQVTGII